MANTYTWSFSHLEVFTNYQSQTNVICTVHWTLTATSSTSPAMSAQIYGSQTLTYDLTGPFIPYNQLTAADVQTWVLAAMGPTQVAALEANLDQQIAEQLNPSTQVLTPPWN